MKRVNLLAGGPVIDWPRSLVNSSVPGIWLGVDRGSLRLIHLDVQNLVAIGDFDSVSSRELAIIKRHCRRIYQFQPKKDDTDTELGLQMAFKRFKAARVVIYGATGGRIDHFLANLFMVLEPRFRKFADRIRIVDRHDLINFYLPGTYQLKARDHYPYLSFVALGPMRLTLGQVEYPLRNHFVRGPRAYVSNRFLTGQPARFSFNHSILAVILSRD